MGWKHCGVGHGHGMKDIVGWESVKVVLEVEVHPAELNLTIISGAEVLGLEACSQTKIKPWIALNWKLHEVVGWWQEGSSAKLLSSATEPISHPAAGGVSIRISMITPRGSVIHQHCYLLSRAQKRGGGMSGQGLVCEVQTTSHWSKRVWPRKESCWRESSGQGHEVQGHRWQLKNTAEIRSAIHLSMTSLHQSNPQTWKDKPISNLEEISIPQILQLSNAKQTHPSRINPHFPDTFVYLR